ncbi:MAG: rubrerythrin family protein [Lachnospiraceae bacterium]|nr:rubrerythrin family protein [Lachnospiraceae bacterium]
MERKIIESGCCFTDIKPVMVELPYPPIQVSERNLSYADLLSVDYCGAVSELTAIAQYINNENRLAGDQCPMAKTLLGMAICEMMHLQKLGELIVLLGGNIGFSASGRNGRPVMWSPSCLNIPSECGKMLAADMEAEKSTISQYEMHISWIKDENVNAVLRRIIQDEEYHIMMLKMLMKEVGCS